MDIEKAAPDGAAFLFYTSCYPGIPQSPPLTRHTTINLFRFFSLLKKIIRSVRVANERSVNSGHDLLSGLLPPSW